MKYTDGVRTAVTAALLLVSPLVGITWVQAQERNDTPVVSGMKITSCTVSSTKDASKTYECSKEAARLCNGKDQCEIQIGYNLTEGKDIDPNAGVVGKIVTIIYACGPISRQRGPYHQSDHASLILECRGPL